MNGMAMMLKSMGFDPEQLQGMMGQFQMVLQQFKDQMDRIELKQMAILENQERLFSLIDPRVPMPSVTHEGINGHG
jgi:hypothetical protein